MHRSCCFGINPSKGVASALDARIVCYSLLGRTNLWENDTLGRGYGFISSLAKVCCFCLAKLQLIYILPIAHAGPSFHAIICVAWLNIMLVAILRSSQLARLVPSLTSASHFMRQLQPISRDLLWTTGDVSTASLNDNTIHGPYQSKQSSYN